jgi:hypothetical protein
MYLCILFRQNLSYSPAATQPRLRYNPVSGPVGASANAAQLLPRRTRTERHRRRRQDRLQAGQHYGN